jgi:hypothetical protein
MSPTFFFPPYPTPTSIPFYSFTTPPDNSFDISRANTPGTAQSNAVILHVDPTPEGAENNITLNGNLLVANSIYASGAVSAFTALKGKIHRLVDVNDPITNVIYEGNTIWLEQYPSGPGNIAITLPTFFFETANIPQVAGTTIFRMVTYTSDTQRVYMRNSTSALLFELVTNIPCVAEAVRLTDTILVYVYPLTASSSVPLVLTSGGVERKTPLVFSTSVTPPM